MLSNQLTKERQAVDAAFSYLCDPTNSLGKRKKSLRHPSLTFGPKNWETAEMFKLIFRLKKKTILQQIIDAAERERAKEMFPIILYSLEQPKDDEFIEVNPLTISEFNALIYP